MNSQLYFFFFSSRRRHTRLQGDWSSDVCSSDLCTGASEGSCVQAAVGQDVLTRHVACVRAAQEGTDGAEFIGRAEAAGRHLGLLHQAHIVQALAALVGGGRGGGAQAIGVGLARSEERRGGE